MVDPIYTASKSRTQGRPGWSVSFRHPLRRDARGKPGLKMRRGLRTDDAASADGLVAEMNELLRDPSWWNAAKRQEAERSFSEVIVDAFYDDIQAGHVELWQLRQDRIPLPTATDGYSKVLFVGTTGVGKTSLLRHIIGSDPEVDRFPSTSTAKTTVSDIEVIQSDGPYSAIVTFFSEFLIRANIEECVADACTAIWEGADDEKVAERLLNHRDQRFRLSYVLGNWQPAQKSTEDDDWSFDDTSVSPTAILDSDTLPESERHQNQTVLARHIANLRSLTQSTIHGMSQELDENVSQLSGQDRDAAQDLFEERLNAESGFDHLVHDILDEVRRRFDYLDAGALQRRRSGWPDSWWYETDDRAEFIRQIRWFSTNHAPQFGRLLTPLVEGIRVRGRFDPKFGDTHPKLVLLDGQGLGHTPESSSSVSTHVTERFADVDVILLVDSAQQPMQAAPLSVIRAVAASGHQGKLCIAFTHFDQVKGHNLPSYSQKKSHVMASVMNSLANLRDILGAPVVRAIERNLDRQCFMLGGLDTASDKLPAGVIRELSRMLSSFADAIIQPPIPTARPVYDTAGLLFAVQAATREFQRPWAARLGLGTHGGVHKEHWTRVKALNTRIAGELAVEYDSLRPVADLIARLIEAVSRFLDSPIDWTRPPSNDEERDAAISAVKNAVYAELHNLVPERLIQQHLSEWRSARDHRGTGSTFRRAREIKGIYDEAAPIPDAAMTPAASAFLTNARTIVHQAIENSGGEVRLLPAG